MKELSDKKKSSEDTDFETSITYFRYSGETNTDELLRLVRKRAIERGIFDVVIASETGLSALRAIEIFRDSKVKITVVTHYPSSVVSPKGGMSIGINRKEYENTRKTLEKEKIDIVQGTRPFVPPSRRGWEKSSMEGIIDSTLELFGSGTKIAIETAIMATDAGKVNPGNEIISTGGTLRGLDTALIVRTCNSHELFKKFEVREIIAKPRFLVHEDYEYPDKNWKGDFGKYYERLKI